MFKWYKRADICLAFLFDVPFNPDHMGPSDNLALITPQPEFSTSRWFTRGWTLQELIAPGSVVFLDATWNVIGTKYSLARRIQEITHIRHEVLAGDYMVLSLATIAEKMSWASKRETTRLEDMAYCLMGLFDVYMPPLYGEGTRAFTRLQEEILRNSSDLSIFAWSIPGRTMRGGDLSHNVRVSTWCAGFLADSPRAFAGCHDFSWFRPVYQSYRSTLRPLKMSSDGIHFTALCKAVRDGSTLIVLGCDEREEPGTLIAVRGLVWEGTTCGRVGDSVEFLSSGDSGLEWKEVCVSKTLKTRVFNSVPMKPGTNEWPAIRVLSEKRRNAINMHRTASI